MLYIDHLIELLGGDNHYCHWCEADEIKRSKEYLESN